MNSKVWFWETSHPVHNALRSGLVQYSFPILVTFLHLRSLLQAAKRFSTHCVIFNDDNGARRRGTGTRSGSAAARWQSAPFPAGRLPLRPAARQRRCDGVEGALEAVSHTMATISMG